MDVIEREDVRRVTYAVMLIRVWEPPRKALCSQVEGAFEIPEYIKCDWVSVFSETEAFYVA